MQSERTPVNTAELNIELNGRVSIIQPIGKIIFRSRIIDDEITMVTDLLKYNANIRPIFFIDCTFNKKITLGSYEKAGNIEFQECHFFDEIIVDTNNIKFPKKCIFQKGVTLNNSLGNSVTQFEDHIVNGNLNINDSPSKVELSKIVPDLAGIELRILIKGRPTNLKISHSAARYLEFKEHLEMNAIEIENCSFEQILLNRILLKKIKLTQSKIEDINTKHLKGTDAEFEINQSSVRNLYISANRFKHILVNNSSFTRVDIVTVIDKIAFIDFTESDISIFHIHHLTNNGFISLKSLKIDRLFSLKSSSLGKIDLITCDFSKAVLEFENSKVIDAFFAETELPKKVLLNNRENHGQAQLAFGQIASAFQKQGDTVRSIEYSSLELKSHYKNISLFVRRDFDLHFLKFRTVWFSKYFFQKINLWFNLVSNDFGRDWARGIFFSIVFGGIFFCCLLISTDRFHLGMPTVNFTLTPAFFKFMNPLRFFELDSLFNNTPFAGEIKLTGLSFVFDFIGRISLAYGYYQTVQAFRRFGRK